MIEAMGIEQLALQLISPIAVTSMFFYMRNVRSDMKDIAKDVASLKNGCYARHEKIAEDRGATRQTFEAIHRRMDEAERTASGIDDEMRHGKGT